jgi:hypothetical protein
MKTTREGEGGYGVDGEKREGKGKRGGGGRGKREGEVKKRTGTLCGFAAARGKFVSRTRFGDTALSTRHTPACASRSLWLFLTLRGGLGPRRLSLFLFRFFLFFLVRSRPGKRKKKLRKPQHAYAQQLRGLGWGRKEKEGSMGVVGRTFLDNDTTGGKGEMKGLRNMERKKKGPEAK